MKLINPKYGKLKPTADYLNDEIVMAQAWKKTHNYMRNHNWYADTLALDVSALSLEYSVKTWAKGAVNSSDELYKIELVPAVKSEPWEIDSEKGWVPKREEDKRKDKPPIRPLAHLMIRDQTWATALMMCLADSVETKQGDCSERDFFKAQRNKVYSYGNRLICDWDDKQALFRWGNGEIYRKFFVDYQNFLKRPVEIGREVAGSVSAPEKVFIVSIDLEKFYDCIEREILVNRFKKLVSLDNKNSKSKNNELVCDIFWESFNKIINWKWNDDAKARASELGLGELEGGIPQGLVAAGFFANGYLLDFDESVGKNIGLHLINDNNITIHDYCRYVDDIRLVISIEKNQSHDEIIENLTELLQILLRETAGPKLKINKSKSKITTLSDLDNKSSLSERLIQIQHELSGPADRDVLEASVASLEGLLSHRIETVAESKVISVDSELIGAVRFDHDIRDDTLKRFASNRLEMIMRAKRRIEPVDAQEHDTSNLDNESELLAKKLVLAWMYDPSLALVLRKALEIYPSTSLAEPIFESVYSRCSFVSTAANNITAAMFDYLLADLFRSCIDFHGYFQRVDYPETTNPVSLINLACVYAQKSIDSKQLPEFIKRQALLLLAVAEKPVRLKKESKMIQENLHAILGGQSINLQTQLLALYEVASQISGSAENYAKQLLEVASKEDPETKRRILDELSKRGGLFWSELWKRLEKSKFSLDLIDEYRWAAPEAISGSVKPVKQKLSKLIYSNENVFTHEAALIKLALALVNFVKLNENRIGYSPKQLLIHQKDKYRSWKEVVTPSFTELVVEEVSLLDMPNDPRYESPDWVEDGDAKAIYWIGNILRAAAVGNSDFTAARWKVNSIQSYKGLRTGWYKRRMGMMHAPEALVGEISTISDWSAELLKTCLQWPGYQAKYVKHKDIADIQDIEMFEKALKQRLKRINKLYCHAIDTPALVTRVRRPEQRHEKGFRLVCVQQLLPRTSAFSDADPTLDSKIHRAANRDHLARICQITHKTLEAKLQAEKKQSYPGADLIVFPELAVHLDDQDLLKRLADKSQSIIFAGLIFTNMNGKLVNLARWFIPDYKKGERQWIIRDQGKKFPTDQELGLGVEGFRPCQQLIEIEDKVAGSFVISGAICYDATDLNLAADLKGKTDLFIIAAHNKDVRTFDAMATALNYHMYQHVVVVNKGEFGGSTIQAPYKESYDRLVSHSHGVDQISISVADLDLAAFSRKSKKIKEVKAKPANFSRIK